MLDVVNVALPTETPTRFTAVVYVGVALFEGTPSVPALKAIVNVCVLTAAVAFDLMKISKVVAVAANSNIALCCVAVPAAVVCMSQLAASVPPKVTVTFPAAAPHNSAAVPVTV